MHQEYTVPSSVWDAIKNDYGKDEILDHLLDDWLADEMQEEAEAQGLMHQHVFW